MNFETQDKYIFSNIPPLCFPQNDKKHKATVSEENVFTTKHKIFTILKSLKKL